MHPRRRSDTIRAPLRRTQASRSPSGAPVKIAIVSINYAPEVTGIGVYTTGMAEFLADEGHEVTCHTAFPYYPAWRKRPQDARRLHALERTGGVVVRRSYLYVPQRPTALRRMLHELSFTASAALGFLLAPRADVVMVVMPPLTLALPVTLIARLRRTRTWLHVQDLQPDAALELGMLKPGRLSNLMLRVERWSYALAERVSTISEGMRARIVAKGVPEAKVELLRNWANDDLVAPQPRDTGFRREWDLGGRFVVLYSGNLGVKQGLPVLLAAAARLRDLEDLVFVIVGDGGEKASLQREAARLGLANVRFQPLQPMERLSELLATADVSVIPQRRGVNDIVLPSKLANILSSARPVVVAALPGSELERIVATAGCGVVVAPEDAAGFEAALRSLHASATLRAEMGERGAAFAVARLGRGAILRGLGERLERAVRAESASEQAV